MEAGARLLPRMVAFLVLATAADLWLRHHHGVGIEDLGSLSVLVVSLTGAAGLLDKIAAEEEKLELVGAADVARLEALQERLEGTFFLGEKGLRVVDKTVQAKDPVESVTVQVALPGGLKPTEVLLSREAVLAARIAESMDREAAPGVRYRVEGGEVKVLDSSQRDPDDEREIEPHVRDLEKVRGVEKVVVERERVSP